jgi:hypothetical protein
MQWLRLVSPRWAKAEIEVAKTMNVIMRIEVVFITSLMSKRLAKLRFPGCDSY